MPNAWELAIFARLLSRGRGKFFSKRVLRNRLGAIERLEGRYALIHDGDLASLQLFTSDALPLEPVGSEQGTEQVCFNSEVSYGGDPYGGDPYGGDPYVGDPYGGDPYGGDPYGGDPYGGDPYGGDPYGGDPYGGDPYGGDPYGGDPGENQAPVITAFDIVFMGDGDWRISGTVEDDDVVEGLEIRFAGDLSAECTVLTGGAFSTVVHLIDVYSGMVSAGFTDSDGLSAETVWCPFG